MKIKAQIGRMVEGKSVKAIASVSLDGLYVVKNLRVVDGRNGLFVSMPQECFTDKQGKKKYSNTFFPVTNMAKADLQEAVLAAYEQKLSQQQGQQQNSGWDTINDGDMVFDM